VGCRWSSQGAVLARTPAVARGWRAGGLNEHAGRLLLRRCGLQRRPPRIWATLG
jgi:hypothetical protein